MIIDGRENDLIVYDKDGNECIVYKYMFMDDLRMNGKTNNDVTRNTLVEGEDYTYETVHTCYAVYGALRLCHNDLDISYFKDYIKYFVNFDYKVFNEELTLKMFEVYYLVHKDTFKQLAMEKYIMDSKIAEKIKDKSYCKLSVEEIKEAFNLKTDCEAYCRYVYSITGKDRDSKLIENIVSDFGYIIDGIYLDFNVIYSNGVDDEEYESLIKTLVFDKINKLIDKYQAL